MATARHEATRGGTWRLEEAKARLSEVVRRAGSEGPQRVTVRGRAAAVVLSAEEYERLSGPGRSLADLFADMRGCGLADIVPERDRDTGRDFEFPE
jgi:antitoxin Phd